MEQRTKRQKVEEATKISENELKRLDVEEEMMKNKITEMQNELKKVAETKLQKLRNLYNDGWFLEIEWNATKKIQFQPFATIDDAQTASEYFKLAFRSSFREYNRRFVRYMKIFLPEVNDELLSKFLNRLIYPQTRIDNIVKAYSEAQTLQDLIKSLTADRITYTKISSPRNYRTPLDIKKSTYPPVVLIKREEMANLKTYTYLNEIKKVDITKFLEFPYGRIATLFPDPIYTQNLLDTCWARRARYWIFLAHAFDKNSSFAKLQKDVIRYLCSFLYIEEIPIEEKK